jgi:phosphoglycerol transferase MdoB-like AlkP superfamily enzyme
MIGITDMNELRKIPLIVNLPKNFLGYKPYTIGGLIDYAPTISNILGINTSGGFFMGRDLMTLDDGFVVFRDGSCLDKRKLLNEVDAQDQLRVSDLIIEKDIVSLIKNNGSNVFERK